MIDTTKHTITYATIASHALKLDIYPPVTAANRPAPAIVYIHGGGLVQGDKRWPVTLGFSAAVKALRAIGYAFVAVNYRLAPRHRWPAQIEDVKCAIRHLRANANAYNLDQQRIGVWGDSAGGHLAAMVGMAGAEAGFEVGGNLDQSSAVQAVVDMFGPTDLSYLSVNPALRWYLRLLLGRGDEQAIRQASPLRYVTSAAPPFLIVHGERDLLVPPRQSQALHERLRAAGVPASLVMVRHANHALLPMGRFIQPARAELNRVIVEFFLRHLG
jgi:acetyl esterase/lipase